MRPRISSWFDSHIRIWRPTETKDVLKVAKQTYVVVAVVGCRLNRSGTTTAQVGAGMTRVGQLRWYGNPDIDIKRRDVCEVIDGPENKLTWEVDAEPVRPGGHHTQVDCVEWHGNLPSLEESS